MRHLLGDYWSLWVVSAWVLIFKATAKKYNVTIQPPYMSTLYEFSLQQILCDYLWERVPYLLLRLRVWNFSSHLCPEYLTHPVDIVSDISGCCMYFEEGSAVAMAPRLFLASNLFWLAQRGVATLDQVQASDQVRNSFYKQSSKGQWLVHICITRCLSRRALPPSLHEEDCSINRSFKTKTEHKLRVEHRKNATSTAISLSLRPILLLPRTKYRRR